MDQRSVPTKVSGERSGVIESFDPQIGLGYISETAPRGASEPEAQEHLQETSRLWRFHSTQLADKSRLVEPGTPVRFSLAPAHGGTFEAVQVLVSMTNSRTFLCPVCGSEVEGRARDYEICPNCDWEDDPVAFDDPSFAGGANSDSLNDARLAWVTRQSSNNQAG